MVTSVADGYERRGDVGDRRWRWGYFSRFVVGRRRCGGLERGPLAAGNVVGSDHVVSANALVVGSQPIDVGDPLPGKGVSGSGRFDPVAEFVKRLAALGIASGRRVPYRLYRPVIRNLQVPLRHGLPALHGYRSVGARAHGRQEDDVLPTADNLRQKGLHGRRPRFTTTLVFSLVRWQLVLVGPGRTDLKGLLVSLVRSR